MMTKKMKKGGACILALAVLLAVLSPGPEKVYGADAIKQPENGCSITFSLADSVIPEGVGGETLGYEDYYDGLAGQNPDGGSGTAVQINVKLYKVADISAGGKYTAAGAFKGIEAELDLSSVSAQTTAEEWQAKAKAAAEAVEETGSLTADKEQNILEQNKMTGLDIGLYLVYVEKDTVKTAEYVYNFTPFLVSLPGNNYYDEVSNGTLNPSDAWQYDVTVGLKPGREPRLGSLVITKTLEGYNKRLGKALFVFDVTARKNGETVYSNVVSLEFDGTETVKTVQVDGILAGSAATVKEVYSGSGYEQTSPPPADVQIKSSEVQAISGTVSFANKYDGRTNGGSGVVNHFQDDGSEGNPNWSCTQTFVNPEPAAGGDSQ